jgi:putative component of membrane protein insertase Oxa1/YidC/SpoIIIJ protein YidD
MRWQVIADAMLCRASVSVIDWYRHVLSPLKGFSCAYRVKNGGLSCSEFGRESFRSLPWRVAFTMICGRIRECREAWTCLRQQESAAVGTRERDPDFDGDPGPEKARAYHECGPSDCAPHVGPCCGGGCLAAGSSLLESLVRLCGEVLHW